MDTRNTAASIVDEWIKWQRFHGLLEGPLHFRSRTHLEALIAERLEAAQAVFDPPAPAVRAPAKKKAAVK